MDSRGTHRGGTASAHLPLILRSLSLVSALVVLPTLSAGAGAAGRAGTCLHLPRSVGWNERHAPASCMHFPSTRP
jgi:hypothetical protein